MSDNPLISAPLGRTLARLAAPSLFGVVVLSLLSVTEAWFVGGIGITALAGVALVFPLYMLTTMLSAGAIGGAVSGATARATGLQTGRGHHPLLHRYRLGRGCDHEPALLDPG